MEEAKKKTDLVAFAPGLPDTPGWAQMSRAKQDEMLDITSRLLQYQSMEGLGIVGQCIELVHARQALEGQPMNITNYTATVFKQGFRTAWRRLADFEEFQQCLPKESQEMIPKVIAEKGALLLRGAAGGGMKELTGAFKKLRHKIPKTKDPKVIEAFIQKDVRDVLREGRRARSENSQIELLDKDTALKIWVNTTVRLVRQTKLRNTDQQKDLLTRGMGMVMQALAIPGAVHTGRQDIPDGFITRRGPKPKRRTEAGAM